MATAPKPTGDNPDMLGIYLKEIGCRRLLTRKEETKLFKQAAKGSQKAREKLVHHNLRLVVFIAKRFANFGLPLVDLIQEGNFGLMIAIDKFNPARGYRLSTYANWWIMQSITWALAGQVDSIRMPVYMHVNCNKFTREEKRLEMLTGKKPSPEEVGQSLGYSKEKTELVFMALKLKWTRSLNEPLSTDLIGGPEFGDLVESSLGISSIDYAQAKQELERALNKIHGLLEIINTTITISKKDKMVFIHLYGLDNHFEKRTLGETGRHYNVCHERIRQIKVKIWARLKRKTGMSENDFLREIEKIKALEDLLGVQANLTINQQ